MSPQFLFLGTEHRSRLRLDERLACRKTTSSWPRGSPISSGAACPTRSSIAWPPRDRFVAEDNLRVQVKRMLRDPRSRALAENFAGQWLQTRKLKEFTPDPILFPEFDEPLRTAMLAETELFFESIRDKDRSVLEFLDADYTFVNERLARHYGIPGVKGDGFRRVSLAGTPRGGVLTQASVLAATSNPTRTSPVKRGKWILENILGAPPAPPPSGVEALKEGQGEATRAHFDSGWNGTGPTRLALHATAAWTRSGSDWRTSTPSAAGDCTKEGNRLIRRASCRAVGRFTGPAELKAALRRAGMRFAGASPRRC